MELLSDPNLLFLDEPASGLDPGTERSLMHSLREMADAGKTVILVTHSTLSWRCATRSYLWEKAGISFFGSCEEALAFFGVSDLVDVYNMITENAPKWRSRYEINRGSGQAGKAGFESLSCGKGKGRFQLPVLCARYSKLVINDRQRGDPAAFAGSGSGASHFAGGRGRTV